MVVIARTEWRTWVGFTVGMREGTRTPPQSQPLQVPASIEQEMNLAIDIIEEAFATVVDAPSTPGASDTLLTDEDREY